MAVSDLTNTTWRLNSTTCTAGYGNFEIDFTLYDDNGIEIASEQEELSVGYGLEFMPAPQRVPQANSIIAYSNLSGVLVNYSIFITGGTDVTNASLISWLEANATQVIPSNEYSLSYTLTNLTNGNVSLTITADEGYSLPSTITVTNGTLVSWDSTTGVAVISEYNANTTVSVECTAAVSGYEVTLSISPRASSPLVSFYDGEDGSAPLLATVSKGSSETVTVTSGYIFFNFAGQDQVICTGDIEFYDSIPTGVIYLVTGDGSITVSAGL